jgi:hypothetical protein
LRDHVTRIGGAVALAAAALLAACQPLPHPFQDDRPPAALLKIDAASVSIAPIEGDASGVAGKLGAAVAAALIKRDIPASDKTTSLGSYPLYGRLVQSQPRDGKAKVTAMWRLYDPQGRTVGEPKVEIEAKTSEVAGDAAIERLAALSAEKLAPLMQTEASTPETAAPGATSPPPSATAAPLPDDRRLRVAVGKISGAPGDGGKSLAAAVTAVLKRQELTMIGDAGKADLVVECEITLTPAKTDQQHVKIVWRVRRADGAEIGKVDMENDVPKGLLDGPWGDLAYTVALAAGEGLMQLVARGAPEGKT